MSRQLAAGGGLTALQAKGVWSGCPDVIDFCGGHLDPVEGAASGPTDSHCTLGLIQHLHPPRTGLPLHQPRARTLATALLSVLQLRATEQLQSTWPLT